MHLGIDLEKVNLIIHFLEIKDMDRPQEILPGKGIEAQAGTAEEIREEWIQHASMAMFEDYSEQYSDDFPNLNQ